MEAFAPAAMMLAMLLGFAAIIYAARR